MCFINWWILRERLAWAFLVFLFSVSTNATSRCQPVRFIIKFVCYTVTLDRYRNGMSEQKKKKLVWYITSNGMWFHPLRLLRDTVHETIMKWNSAKTKGEVRTHSVGDNEVIMMSNISQTGEVKTYRVDPKPRTPGYGS